MQRKIVGSFTALALIAALLVVSGCSKKENGGTSITLGTAGAAGTYFVVGAAMSQTVNELSEFLHVTAQVTNGSVENINLTNAGEMDMGMSNSDGVYWATTGTGPFAGRPQNISVVMSLYLSCGQMATLRGSNINSWADLRGKRVVLGPPGTTIVEMSRAILRGYGIDPETDIRPLYLSFDEGLSELMDGTIDASFFVAAAPTAAMTNASATGRVQLLGVSQNVIESVSNELPFFTPHVIPAGTYPNMDGDIHTLKIVTEIFANNTISEDVIYEFVRLTLDNTELFVGSHVAAQEINISTAASSISKYHPGALKFFRERGVL
ncbi:MAG: TAXI family TRAP transporter solute-binding subunit [Treponema sp.]|nr:TAXI family TRAP transporter solute-binding subunit [Treponema sp.]